MKIMHKPTATVGLIIKDLELIIAKSPDIYVEQYGRYVSFAS